jgi:ribonuclease HII
MPHTKADLRFETAVLNEKPTFTHICGIDEAGRGALAGPVVAAAVILPLNAPNQLAALAEVNDSKQLSAKKRESYYNTILLHAVTVGVGIVSEQVIDEQGIIFATKQAMETAVSQLAPTPDYLLIDGRIKLPSLDIPQKSIIRGDSQSLSIAAASIIAKVSRDLIMIHYARQYSRYDFAQHKGYGTQAHRDAIAQHGPCPIHRHTFAPIRQ